MVFLFVLPFQLSVRRKNAKEMFGGFFKNMVKTADEVILAGIKVGLLDGLFTWRCFSRRHAHFLIWYPTVFPTQEVDEFFEQEKTFLLDYYSKIKDSTGKAEKMTRAHKSMLEFIISKVPI